jgi:hypothetical protein
MIENKLIWCDKYNEQVYTLVCLNRYKKKGIRKKCKSCKIVKELLDVKE